MTVEEIKQQHPIREEIERYGIKINRNGFCKCPFHHDGKSASLKVYKDSFHCFGCHADGDVIKFVMLMDNCDFKTAFYSLGGTYQKPTRKSEMALYHARKAKETKQQNELRIKHKMQHNNELIKIYSSWLNRLEPLSDAWCDCQNALTICLYHDEEYTKELEGM